MAIYTITSDAKPSVRHHGWFYAYYDKQTANGRACTVAFPASVKDLVKPGLQFDEDTNVRWDDSLKTSVLQLDFDEFSPLEEPGLPNDPESGWGDPDCLPPAPPALVPAEPALAAVGANGNGNNGNGHHAPVAPAVSGNGRGVPMRAPAYRKAEAAKAVAQGAQLPAAYLKINREVAQSFLFQLAMIGTAVGEQRRADVAQKLCAIASIPYYRQIGIELSDDDIKGMTTL